MLGVRPAFGRVFTASDTAPGAEPEILLSYGMWRSRFGGAEGVIGTRVNAVDLRHPEARTAYTIIGVMPPRFHFSEGSRVDAWLILPTGPDQGRYAQRGVFETVGRLKRGVRVKTAEREMRG